MALLKVSCDTGGQILKIRAQKYPSWTFCGGVVVTYLVVGMYFSLSQIFFEMKLFVSIFVLSLFHPL